MKQPGRVKTRALAIGLERLQRDIEPDPATTKTLQDFVKATIAPYKYPRAIEYRSELPKTPTGKLQRFRLRQDAEGAAG